VVLFGLHALPVTSLKPAFAESKLDQLETPRSTTTLVLTLSAAIGSRCEMN
jgi:hypothetical protein